METIDFATEFVRKYPDHEFLVRYVCEAIGKDHVVWSDFSAMNLTKIANYIKNKVSSNSANTYFSLIKSLLNLVYDDVEIPTRKFTTILKTKAVPQENVALEEEEIERIYQYYLELLKKGAHSVEKGVLTLFLIECYCGARGVDVEKITFDNISNNRLTYVAQKTYRMATMPVHRRLYFLLRNKPTREYDNQVKNEVVKRVCKKCGIDEMTTLFYHGKMVTDKKYRFCAFHTARRSFASILASKGVPVVEIMQYMSHKNISMTERYIKVNRNKTSAAAMEFFNG